MAKNNDSDSPSVNLIGAGTVIKGNIKSEGDIRIDGSLKGTIISKGKVVVGSTGEVEGEICCEYADISGTVKIKITVSEVLLLKPTAKLTGDIITNKLAIESGATFSGTCSMGAIVKDISKSGSELPDSTENGETVKELVEKSA
ncbi:MAG TPA: polymer-forming cytoskeletal protein [Flavobacteriales bacterium]|nr:polymer-forming cytoskeletal protein [Flavobacteriales bacterium]HIA11091.1 polymer-forming cytoskeletal protein [Flavobacteriales bacterium]HIO71959.1 polymer-forming cytoskeletal protein [Flavobacteriales bacterium]